MSHFRGLPNGILKPVNSYFPLLGLQFTSTSAPFGRLLIVFVDEINPTQSLLKARDSKNHYFTWSVLQGEKQFPANSEDATTKAFVTKKRRAIIKLPPMQKRSF